MVLNLKKEFEGRRILILGFGKEGQSSLRFFRNITREQNIAVADENEQIIHSLAGKQAGDITFYTGADYLEHLNQYDYVVKSPGIPLERIIGKAPPDKITSQANIFLKFFGKQVIGITGTKGKSTTSNLIYHILKKAGKDVFLVGNIGLPSFDVISNLSENSLVVYELSSHQLATVGYSPGIAVLLNLFEEHLDYYKSFSDYVLAKLNIAKYQDIHNSFVFNAGDPVIREKVDAIKLNSKLLPYASSKSYSGDSFIDENKWLNIRSGEHLTFFDFNSRKNLPGDHNLLNILAAATVCKNLGINDRDIENNVFGFKGLPHRLEYIGMFKNIHFYNDSIATIPEATIEAIKTLKNVDTLILGGKDRGVDYSNLISFIRSQKIPNLIFMGEAGKRIFDEGNFINSDRQHNFLISDFMEISNIIRQNTHKGGIVLLSPAAPSYGMFTNFEERGKAFKKIAEGL